MRPPLVWSSLIFSILYSPVAKPAMMAAPFDVVSESRARASKVRSGQIAATYRRECLIYRFAVAL